MRKFMIASALCASCLLTGCTAVVVRQPSCHILVKPGMPPQDLPPRFPEQSKIERETSGAVYFFRFGW